MNITNLWKSGFVRRWHRNPDLAHTVDPNAGHQWRVAMLVDYMIPNCPRDVIMAAMVHDVAELVTGDLPHDSDLKDTPEYLYETAKHTPKYFITDYQKRVIKLCDMMDAYKWMVMHKPALADNMDWVEMYSAMDNMAHAFDLDVHDKFNEVMND